ncbi:hypothetical protein B0H19DRAFT_1247547 [Mycena capillaripes]|nr:hypothetical protein B0H19DRAFT_1247547 [Mycena capillaripes]
MLRPSFQAHAVQASLVTNFPAVHGSLFGEALLLCFKLQESKLPAVSSTTAATLRQLATFVFNKMVDEDRRDDSDPAQWLDMKLTNATTKSLGASARNTFSLQFLHKTFALELIESVLTNYHNLFQTGALLQLHLCPLLKALSDRPFPLTLRFTRVIFLLLNQVARELEKEAEIFLILLIKLVGWDHSEQSEQAPLPDAELIRSVWARYNAHQSGSNVFTALTALKRLVAEKPTPLGVSTQIFGVGVQSDNGGNVSNSVLDVAGMARMATTAASATVSGVVGMMGRCVSHPESYIYLFAVQGIISLCEGFAAFTGPLYGTIVIQRSHAAGEAAVRAPPALSGVATTTQLHTVQPQESWFGIFEGLRKADYVATFSRCRGLPVAEHLLAPGVDVERLGRGPVVQSKRKNAEE